MSPLSQWRLNFQSVVIQASKLDLVMESHEFQHSTSPIGNPSLPINLIILGLGVYYMNVSNSFLLLYDLPQGVWYVCMRAKCCDEWLSAVKIVTTRWSSCCFRFPLKRISSLWLPDDTDVEFKSLTKVTQNCFALRIRLPVYFGNFSEIQKAKH